MRASSHAPAGCNGHACEAMLGFLSTSQMPVIRRGGRAWHRAAINMCLCQQTWGFVGIWTSLDCQMYWHFKSYVYQIAINSSCLDSTAWLQSRPWLAARHKTTMCSLAAGCYQQQYAHTPASLRL